MATDAHEVGMLSTDHAGDWLQRELWVVVAIVAAFFVNLGGVPLFDLDEGFFSASTLEMLQRGDFITTYVNGTPEFHKPILIYWLQALSVSIFGLNEWGLRLPSALAASAWVYAVLAFARPRLGRGAGVIAAVMTATALAVMVIGRASTADALLNLWITLAMLDAWRHIEQPRATTIYRVYLWMGLGMLTKGPVAVAIPFVVTFIYYLSVHDLRTWLRAIFNPVGWAVFLVVAAPWYVLIYLEHGQAFIDGFFLTHNVGRFTDTMEGHGGQLYYYLVALPFIVMPFTGPLLRAVARVGEVKQPGMERFLWMWFGFVFVVFSLSGTQLPHYMLYGTTPLFVLMARHGEDLRSRWLAFSPPVLLMMLFLFLPEIVAIAAEQERNVFIKAILSRADEVLGIGYRVGVAVALIGVLILALMRSLPPIRGLLGVGVIQALAVALVVGPGVAEVQQGPIKRAAIMARDLEGPIVMWGLDMPSFTVYRRVVTPERAPQPGEIVVTRINRLERLGPHEVLFNQGGVVLARVFPQ
jgi:4-amino-4-deoxy-L-arabinose transferase-like glycosyltransferase